MLRRILKRLALGAGVVLVVITVTFFLISLAPGDPARLWVAPGAGAEELEAARRALGLDRPLAARYGSWLWNFVRGDWGVSLAQQQAVTRIIADALPHTLLLSVSSLLVSYIVGVTIGVAQAIKRRSPLDTGLTVTTLLVYGMPAYWLAIMLVLVFAYGAARYDWPAWLQLPAMGATALDSEFYTGWGRVVDRMRQIAER